MRKSIRHDPFPVDDAYGGIYAHGVQAPSGLRTLYISGQVGVTAEGELAGDFHDQCRQAIGNLSAVLRHADMTLRDIVKMSFFLIRPQDMASLVKVRKELLSGVRPAVTTVFVAGLVSPDWLVEIEAIACAP